jgi:hypothetical protein
MEAHSHGVSPVNVQTSVKLLKKLLAPVQDIIPWTETLFPKVTQRSEYSGPPNDDVDAAWDSLYTKCKTTPK